MNDKEKSIEAILVDLESKLLKPDTCECGEQYQYEGLGIYKCGMCGSIFKNEYAIVRDFVDEYGTNYNIQEISERTGVPKRLIDLFVKDGRFLEVKKQKLCKFCKVPIVTGHYCNRCALLQIKEGLERDHPPKTLQSSVGLSGNMAGEMHHLRKED